MFKTASSKQQPSPAPAQPTTLRLQHLLLGHGRKPELRRSTGLYDYEGWTSDDPASVKLFVMEISTAHIIFQTSSLLTEGESLELELLLQGAGAWKGSARIQWSLESQPGFRSMALLTCAPDQARRLELFVQLQANGSRG